LLFVKRQDLRTGLHRLMEQHQQYYCVVIVPLFRFFFAAWELDHKRSHFRLTQFLTCRWAANMVCFCYKFIILMPDDSLERKGSNIDRKAIWKTLQLTQD